MANHADSTETAIATMRLISSSRIDVSDEKAAQAQIEQLLTDAGVTFERECKLSASDIPDFLLSDGLAIEVKLRRARKMAVYRQLQRYAAHDQVRAILLVTSLSMGLPPEIGGKPTYYASLGRAWL